MDPLTLVATTITLVESVSATYKLIQHLSGLPKAFEKVNESLPLSREILQSARDELQNRQTIAPNVAEPISATLKTCQAKLDTLLNIFQKIEEKNKEHQQSKDGKEWSVVSIYHSTLQNAGRMTKAHRVEALMQDIMNKLKALAINQVFKTATQAQVGRLEVAIQELAKVEPSIPDADLDDAGSLNATQNVAAGGKGNQAINRGGHQDNTFGHRFDTGGGKMTFGTIPE
ncbi:hypothetical protein MMC10_002371 [Thelotrema lepadinum]|nr:hypothetical protein [Thelotrema lepadinum]